MNFQRTIRFWIGEENILNITVDTFPNYLEGQTIYIEQRTRIHNYYTIIGIGHVIIAKDRVVSLMMDITLEVEDE